MKTPFSPIITPKQVVENEKINPILWVDARAGSNAFEDYQKEHIAGAVFVDLNTQLADIQSDVSNGGRHPLPTPTQFCNLLNQLGITPESHVVVYDEVNCSNAASRFWWMMKSIGHQNIQVLNGGIFAAKKAGFSMKLGVETNNSTSDYSQTNWILPTADIHEVEVARKDSKKLVIDVRDAYRFEGESEPIDLIAGHIPGAINVPYSQNLDEKGDYLPKEILKEKYLKIMGEKSVQDVIVHCGSGVTACHTLLAMDYAGLEIPKLYVGSWSEWSRNNREMAGENLRNL
jgi:thiosulfate/3-mercaptopyruvate sulfurtransferase